MISKMNEMDYDIWYMIYEMNGIDFGLWTQQRWSGGKIMWRQEHNGGGVHKYKQDGTRRWLKIATMKK